MLEVLIVVVLFGLGRRGGVLRAGQVGPRPAAEVVSQDRVGARHGGQGHDSLLNAIGDGDVHVQALEVLACKLGGLHVDGVVGGGVDAVALHRIARDNGQGDGPVAGGVDPHGDGVGLAGLHTDRLSHGALKHRIQLEYRLLILPLNHFGGLSITGNGPGVDAQAGKAGVLKEGALAVGVLLQGGQVDHAVLIGHHAAVHIVAVSHGLRFLGQDVGHAGLQVQGDLAVSDGHFLHEDAAGGGQLIEVGGLHAAPAVGHIPGAEVAGVGVSVNLVLHLGAPGDKDLSALGGLGGLAGVIRVVEDGGGVDLGDHLAVLGNGSDVAFHGGDHIVGEDGLLAGLPAQKLEVLQVLGGQVVAVEHINAIAKHVVISPVGDAGQQGTQNALVGGRQVAHAVADKLHDLALGAAGGVVHVGVPVDEGDHLVQVLEGLGAHGNADLVKVLHQLGGLIAGAGLVHVQVHEVQVGQGVVKLLDALLQRAGPDVLVLVHQVGLVEPVPVILKLTAGDDAAHVRQHGVEAVQGELGGVGVDAVLDAVLQTHVDEGVEAVRAALLQAGEVVVAVGVVVAGDLIALVHNLHAEAVGQVAQGLGLIEDPQEGLGGLAGHVHGDEHPLVLGVLIAIGQAHDVAVGHAGVLPGDGAVSVLIAANDHGDVGLLLVLGVNLVVVLPGPGGAVQGEIGGLGDVLGEDILAVAVLGVVLHRGGDAGGGVVEHAVGEAGVGRVLRRALQGDEVILHGAPAGVHAHGRAHAQARQGQDRVVAELEGPHGSRAVGLHHAGDLHLQGLAGDGQHHGEGGVDVVGLIGGHDLIGGGGVAAGHQPGGGVAQDKVVGVLGGVVEVLGGVHIDAGILAAHQSAVGQDGAGQILIGVDIGELAAHQDLHLVGLQGDIAVLAGIGQDSGEQLVDHLDGAGIEGHGLAHIQAHLALAGEDAVQPAQLIAPGVLSRRVLHGAGADGQGVALGLVIGNPVGAGAVGGGDVPGAEVDGRNVLTAGPAAGHPLGAVIPDGGVVVRILVVEDQAELVAAAVQLDGVGGVGSAGSGAVHVHARSLGSDLGAPAGREAGHGLAGGNLHKGDVGAGQNIGAAVGSGLSVGSRLVVEVQLLDQAAVRVELLDVVKDHRQAGTAAHADGKAARAGIAAGDGVAAHGEPAVLALPHGFDGDVGAAVLNAHQIGGIGAQGQRVLEAGILTAAQAGGVMTRPGGAAAVDGQAGVLGLVHIPGQEAQGGGHAVSGTEGDLVGAVLNILKIKELNAGVVAARHLDGVAVHTPECLVDIDGLAAGDGGALGQILIVVVVALGHLNGGQAGVGKLFRLRLHIRGGGDGHGELSGGDRSRVAHAQRDGKLVGTGRTGRLLLRSVHGGGKAALHVIDLEGNACVQPQGGQLAFGSRLGGCRVGCIRRSGGILSALNLGLGRGQDAVGRNSRSAGDGSALHSDVGVYGRAGSQRAKAHAASLQVGQQAGEGTVTVHPGHIPVLPVARQGEGGLALSGPGGNGQVDCTLFRNLHGQGGLLADDRRGNALAGLDGH